MPFQNFPGARDGLLQDRGVLLRDIRIKIGEQVHAALAIRTGRAAHQFRPGHIGRRVGPVRPGRGIAGFEINIVQPHTLEFVVQRQRFRLFGDHFPVEVELRPVISAAQAAMLAGGIEIRKRQRFAVGAVFVERRGLDRIRNRTDPPPRAPVRILPIPHHQQHIFAVRRVHRRFPIHDRRRN